MSGSSKMVKPVLLGSLNHARPVSVFGLHSPKIFDGRSKYSNMLKYDTSINLWEFL
jgi:hypothetical protein